MLGINESNSLFFNNRNIYLYSESLLRMLQTSNDTHRNLTEAF